ncbi:hypothetical protein ACHWQZ_G013616 [Mnemiopsis leidyi]
MDIKSDAEKWSDKQCKARVNYAVEAYPTYPPPSYTELQGSPGGTSSTGHSHEHDPERGAGCKCACGPGCKCGVARNDDKVTMEKNITVLHGVCIIVGTIIGAGIFVSPNSVSKRVGSPAMSILIWIGGGLLSTIGAITFLELGTMLPQNGGQMVYLRKAFGGCLSFLSCYLLHVLLGGLRRAIGFLTFGKYFWAVFYDNPDDAPEWANRLLCIGICWLILGLITMYPNLTLKVIDAVTFFKMASLGLVIILGFVHLCQGHTENIAVGFKNTSWKPQEWGEAWNSVLWAYNGWISLSVMLGEVKDPKMLPRIVAISMTIVMILYVLAVTSYHIVLDMDTMKSGSALASKVAGIKIGQAGEVFFAIAVAVSTLGNAMCASLASSRFLQAGGRQEILPGCFGLVNKRFKTPMFSLLFVMLASTLFISFGNVYKLINTASFSSFAFTTLCAVGLLVMRKKFPAIPRPVKELQVLLYLVSAPSTLGAPAPSTLGVPAPSTVGVPVPSTLGVPAPSILGVPAPSTLGAHAPSTLGVPAPSTLGVPAPSTLGVPAPSTLEVPAPRTLGVPAPSTLGVPAPSTLGVAAHCTLEVAAPSTLGVPAPRALGAPAPSILGVPAPSTLGVPAPSTLGVPALSTLGVPIPRAPAPSTLGVPAPSTLGLPAPSTLGVPAPSTLGAHAPSTLGVPAPSILGVPAPSTLGVPAPSTLGVPAPSTLGVPAPSTLGVPAPSTLGVPAPSTLGFPAPSTLGVAAHCTLGVAAPSTLGVPAPRALGAPAPSILGVPAPSTLGVPAPSTLGVPAPSTLGVPVPSTLGVPAPSTVGVPVPVNALLC